MHKTPTLDFIPKSVVYVRQKSQTALNIALLYENHNVENTYFDDVASYDNSNFG